MFLFDVVSENTLLSLCEGDNEEFPAPHKLVLNPSTLGRNGETLAIWRNSKRSVANILRYSTQLTGSHFNDRKIAKALYRTSSLPRL